jgi:hypothetical protein
MPRASAAIALVFIGTSVGLEVYHAMAPDTMPATYRGSSYHSGGWSWGSGSSGDHSSSVAHSSHGGFGSSAAGHSSGG